MIKRAEVFFLPDLTTQSELGRRETQLQMFRLHLQYCENMMKTDGVVTNNIVPVAILFCCTFSFDIFKYILCSLLWARSFVIANGDAPYFPRAL